MKIVGKNSQVEWECEACNCAILNWNLLIKWYRELHSTRPRHERLHFYWSTACPKQNFLKRLRCMFVLEDNATEFSILFHFIKGEVTERTLGLFMFSEICLWVESKNCFWYCNVFDYLFLKPFFKKQKNKNLMWMNKF